MYPRFGQETQELPHALVEPGGLAVRVDAVDPRPDPGREQAKPSQLQAHPQGPRPPPWLACQGHEAVVDQGPAALEQASRDSRAGGADRLEDRVQAAGPGSTDLVHVVHGPVVLWDATQTLHHGSLGRGDRAIHDESPQSAQVQEGRAHAAGSALHQYRGPVLHRGVAAQHLVCGGVVEHHGRRRVVVHGRGDGHHAVLAHVHHLGVAAGHRVRGHPVADPEVLHLGAARAHHTRHVVARCEGVPRPGESSSAPQDVPQGHTRAVHADRHLARTRRARHRHPHARHRVVPRAVGRPDAVRHGRSRRKWRSACSCIAVMVDPVSLMTEARPRPG